MGNWSIELCSRPLRTARIIDPLVGKFLSHSFIRVKNDQGHAVLELHGRYRSVVTALFNSAARIVTRRTHHFSTIDMRALTSDRIMARFAGGQTVSRFTQVEGPEDIILRFAECMARAAKEIHQDNTAYYLGGPGGGKTCHAVSSLLFRRVGIDITGMTFPFKMPGRRTNLEQDEPNLGHIHVDYEAPLSDIKARLYESVLVFSPDAKKYFAWIKDGTPRPVENFLTKKRPLALAA